MTQQIVHGKRLEGFKGFACVLGAGAVLYIFALIMQSAARRSGMGALQLISWALAIVLVVFVMKRFVAEYRYTLSDGTLVLERTMGSTHGRVLYALPVTDLLALDDEAALKARFGENTHIESLTLAGCTLPRRALAFKKDGQTCIAVLQMDAPFEEALREAIANPPQPEPEAQQAQ